MSPKQNSPKHNITSRQGPRCRTATTGTGRRNWVDRLAAEVVHRCRIALFAPTIQRTLAIERERAHAEREKLAEEYAHGYLDGWHECYATCLEAVEESVAGKRDIWAAGELIAGSSLKAN